MGYTLVNITSKLIFPQSSNIYAYFCKLNTFVFMVGNLTRVLMHAVQQKIAYYILRKQEAILPALKCLL